MPCASTRRADVSTAAQMMFAYAEADPDAAIELYEAGASLFHAAAPRVRLFQTCIKRVEAASGSKTLGEKYLHFNIRRAGSMLFQMALCLEVKGVKAVLKSGGSANGVAVSSSASALEAPKAQPYWADYFGLAALACADLAMGGSSMLTMHNSSLLIIEETQGVFNHTAKKLIGVHANDPVAPWDSAKYARTYIVPLNYFFCRSSGSAMPSSAIGFHGMDITVSLNNVGDLLIRPDVTSAQAGGSGDAKVQASFDVFVRAAADVWDSAPSASDKISNANALSDVYLLATIVYLDPEETDDLMNDTYTLNTTKYATYQGSSQQTAKPSDDVAFVQKIPMKRPIDAIYMFARQAGAQFSALHGGAMPQAPTKNQVMLKNILVELDSNKVYDCSEAENAYDRLLATSQNTDKQILMASWSLDTSLDIAVGSLFASASCDLTATATIAKEAFVTAATQSKAAAADRVLQQKVDVFTVVQYKEPLTLTYGMISATK